MTEIEFNVVVRGNELEDPPRMHARRKAVFIERAEERRLQLREALTRSEGKYELFRKRGKRKRSELNCLSGNPILMGFPE